MAFVVKQAACRSPKGDTGHMNIPSTRLSVGEIISCLDSPSHSIRPPSPMSPPYARKCTSRGRPSKEDCYRAEKALSRKHSIRERILQFLFNKPSPGSASYRNTLARKDSLELAVIAYRAKPRAWTDVYDDCTQLTQPKSASKRCLSTHTDSSKIRQKQQVMRMVQTQDGSRGHRDENTSLDDDRDLRSLSTAQEHGVEGHDETGRGHEGTDEGDKKPRPKKRVHFLV